MMVQLIIPAIIGLQAGVLGQGLGTLGPRARFPGIPAGSIQSAARIIKSLVARRLQPRTITGPLGNLVVGTAEQDLETLAAEAALRRLQGEVVAELLVEDPLIFIRNLPFGDPRRVAVGLDPPGSAGLPSATASPGPGGSVDLIRGPASGVPITTAARRAASAGRAAFFTRNLGRFAVR